jgi:HEAT repeat protein
VRLKAIDGLKAYAKDQRTRQALTRVLLNDTNPGVRAQAIDVLTQVRSQDMVGPLQELLRKEDNGYVRMRTERVLEEMKASPGIF